MCYSNEIIKQNMKVSHLNHHDSMCDEFREADGIESVRGLFTNGPKLQTQYHKTERNIQ